MTTIHDTTDQAPRFASPVDYEAYGQYERDAALRLARPSADRPTLARFDLSYNPLGKISERPLTSYQNLWGYARDLYQRPAFGGATEFGAFGTFAAGPTPSFFNDAPWRIRVKPVHADWDSPHRRDQM